MSDEPALVHRAVRPGAWILTFGVLQFIAAMIAVQAKYPGYSLSANYISDLGGAHSPWALVFDGSVILLGVCAILGSLLIRSAFHPSRARSGGLLFLFIAGVGAIGVGVFPETTPVLNGNMHVIVSFIAFLGSGLALLILSLAMAGDARWSGHRVYAAVSGLVTLIAIALFGTNIYLGLGPGGMERLVVAPILLWGILEGVHMARLPRFAPASMPAGTRPRPA
jgi:hypothetical membrane protein